MPSRPWINKDAVARLGTLQASYKKISTTQAVTDAATTAGQKLQAAMRQTIWDDPSLDDYLDVGDAITVYSTNENVYVGVPENSPLIGKATQMEERYPVSQSSLDLDRQTGETSAAFLSALAQTGGFK
jgi:hypothetical protein